MPAIDGRLCVTDLAVYDALMLWVDVDIRGTTPCHNICNASLFRVFIGQHPDFDFVCDWQQVKTKPMLSYDATICCLPNVLAVIWKGRNISMMQIPGSNHVTLHIITVIVMMTSSNGNIFRVTGHLCWDFTGPRWIPRTKASDAELWCFLWSASE